jgi:hypothetical protein
MRYLVEYGRTRPETLLITIKMNPTPSTALRGRMRSRIIGRITFSFGTLDGVAGTARGLELIM